MGEMFSLGNYRFRDAAIICWMTGCCRKNHVEEQRKYSVNLNGIATTITGT